ncbi:MAG TPA: actin-binding WH2 domain-containing protein [candidate division Zixibacteria bacterium]|nr:actin-binding WH2 domain-containing protein [candidate division Zixibacteria bacterium]
MKIGDFFSLENYPTLSNSEAFFNKIVSEESAAVRLFNQLVPLLIFLFLYGLVMGAYQGLLQSVISAFKLPILFILALLICFPAFFIIQFILGSRLKIKQVVSIVLSGFVLMSFIMLAFTPIVVIFLLTGSNYYFLHLLHVAIFVFAGIFGMNTIVQALKYSCEIKNVYPKTGVVVFRFWVVILAFVGIQLAWNFRPFLGVRGEPVQLFGQREGNFYTAMIDSIRKLVHSDRAMEEKNSQGLEEQIPQTQPLDTTKIRQLFGDSPNGK